ncbi:MAG TPA: YceH family protein [Burkholderiaceae bacterium]|nr:YceH family protein [Burkholderiaceae bacterium]
MPMPPLSLVETRVLGVLVEKEKTVPDTYPLSLNALVAGCNQKNARSPVLTATEAEVQRALDDLRGRSLVIESSGARVTRYSHNVARVLKVPDQAVALLAALMLRGPQTAGELRGSAERLHPFADISSVEAFLAELAERAEERGGPLVVRLPRAAGEREARWAHLLSGPVEVSASPALPRYATESGQLAAEVVRLAAEVDALRAELAELRRRLPEP